MRRGRQESEVGLCARCAHAATQPNARGSVFWRCRAADGDERLLRYPPLPVTACHAHRAGDPATADQPFRA